MFCTYKSSLITLLILLLSCFQLYAQEAVTVEGFVLDGTTGEPLPGANVKIEGSLIGSSTDLNGKYTIAGLPSGSYVFSVIYIGYKKIDQTVNVQPGDDQKINFVLEPVTIEGDVIVVSAQREGQMAAINQQINAISIKNIVSADKIEELPESNAAEAVGRLPGISLQREGGEGNKVVIRGLAPKYNKVQIDGVDMAGTDAYDRSTDLSMISPTLLGGIEVTKSAMADQDADQLGGTVNFILKGAPYTGPVYNFTIQGGYNDLRYEYGDYKISGQARRRFMDDLIGVSTIVDVERRNRSSNTVSAGYDTRLIFDEDGNEQTIAVVNSLNIQDISREVERFNASLVFDYNTTSTKAKLSSLFSRANRTQIYRNENTTGLQVGATNRNQRLSFSESTLYVVMNQFKIEQLLGDFKIDFGLNYTYSKDNMPEEISYGGTEAGVQKVDNTTLPNSTKPAEVPNYIVNDFSRIRLSSLTDNNFLTKEDEFGTNLDFDWEYRLSDDVNIHFKFGGKYKHKTRKYDFDTIYLNTSVDPSSSVSQAILEKWPWMSAYAQDGKFLYEPFIDSNYDPGDFMQGEYSLERIPSLNLGKELIQYLEDELGVEWNGTTVAPQRFTPNFHTSKLSDYDGSEKYFGAYFMPTVFLGTEITFIPGIRYEHNQTEYTGVRGIGSKAVSEGYDYHEKSVTRKNDFFLPMIHTKYKPFNWFDVRASYTHTVTRPSYREFLPSWHIYVPLSIDYSNPNLKPAKAKNYDLYFSFYGQKTGLFTIGLFAKQIDDLIFPQNQIILSDTIAVTEFGLTEAETGLIPAAFDKKPIYSYVNNPNKSELYGIEVEWQTNFWYLPGLLKNIVFGINYTFIQSETKYPRTVPIYETIQGPFGPQRVIVGNADSAYTARMLYQPDHILNLTLGYDFHGFSIRASMQYKYNILSGVNWQPGLRETSSDLYLFDLAVSQKLPFKGLVLFGNVKNLTKTIETNINNGTGYMSNKEYYGLTADIGLKFKF